MGKNILNDETLKHIHSQLKRLKSFDIFYCQECYIKAGKVAGNIYTYNFENLTITNDRKDIEIKFNTEQEMIAHRFKDSTCLLDYVNKHGEVPEGIWLIDDIKVFFEEEEDEDEE